MRSQISLMLDLMERTFRDYEEAMPEPPQFVELSFGPAYRFPNPDVFAALIQKLARVQSAVRAALLLLSNGCVQEQAMLHRVIDETNEDIMFLVYGVTNNNMTELHERFLAAFWEEEIDESGAAIMSEQKRPMVPRQKIQAYLAKTEGLGTDPSTHQNVIRTISKAYSGYVHGASPHLMEMYGGDPPHFHTNGMLGTPRMKEHADDLWNYVYRSFISHIAVGKALGATKHVDILTEHLDEINREIGMR
jgi:hypothetical protein